MYDAQVIKQLNPEWFPPTTPTDIITGVLILSLLFIVPYLYIMFLEDRVISFFGDRLVPFIKFRLGLKKFIDLVHRILEMQVFGNPRSKI